MKRTSRSSFKQLLTAWNNTTTEKSVSKLTKPIALDAWGNVILKQRALASPESSNSITTKIAQLQKERKREERAQSFNPEDRLPKRKILRLPKKIRLENKLKKETQSPPGFAENSLNLLINRVSPPNRTMTAFEPVLAIKTQRKVESQKPRLTPIK